MPRRRLTSWVRPGLGTGVRAGVRAGVTAGAVAALLLALAACTGAGSGPAAGRSGAPATGPAGSSATAGGTPSAASAAQQLQDELARPGDGGWRVRTPATTTQLAGYMSPASTTPGGTLSLHLRSDVPAVHVAVYRSGWYGGAGGRLVWSADIRALPPTPPTLLRPATRTWTADWPESTPIPTAGWVPGHYLVLASAGDRQTWVPFTVRSPSFRDTVVLVTENTTWQAYNAYGGASLYHGSNGSRSTRAYAVSHDRPLDYGAGAGDYTGNELPLIKLAERLRLPLSYATDTDLEAAPGLLDGARAVISLGHDEYYSTRMRDQLLRARDSTGTNLAFLGANAVFRHIRLEPIGGVPNRLEVNYKDPALDPLTATDPAESTADWPSGPRPRSGAELTGASYQCNPVTGPLVVKDPASWLTTGLGLSVGQQLPELLGSEYDSIVPSPLAPKAIVSIFSSPLTCSGRRGTADFAYYTVPSGAGGVDVGTSTWVCVLDDVCGTRRIPPAVRDVVTAITTRILTEFAKGPAGRAHPIR